MTVNRKKAPVKGTCRRFAAIAVKKGFVTPEQARTALLEQLEDDLSNRQHRLVGAILFQKNFITLEQIDMVLTELFPKTYRRSG